MLSETRDGEKSSMSYIAKLEKESAARLSMANIVKAELAEAQREISGLVDYIVSPCHDGCTAELTEARKEIERTRDAAYALWEGYSVAGDVEKRNEFGKVYDKLFGEHPFDRYMRHEEQPAPAVEQVCEYRPRDVNGETLWHSACGDWYQTSKPDNGMICPCGKRIVVKSEPNHADVEEVKP